MHESSLMPTRLETCSPAVGSICLRKLVMVAGTLGQGGAERQLYYQLKTLREAGVSVRVLCLTRGEFWEKPIRDLGVPLSWVGASSSRLLRLVRIARAVRAEPPQALQSAHFFTNLYVSETARLLGLPEIGAIRNNVTSELAMGLLGSWSLRRPRWLAANSRAGIVAATERGVAAGRCFLLPNVVDTDVFRPANSRPSRDEVTLLAVGRLVEQKRMDRFLHVVRQVRRLSSKPVRAVIVGDGPLRRQLESQAAEQGGGAVEFRGTLANLAPVYQEADVLVLASDWEGTPNVVMEAMACGLPVVATAAGGVADLMSGDVAGRVVGVGDEAGLARAVLELVESEALREEMGAGARRLMEREHSLGNLALHLEALYQRVLA